MGTTEVATIRCPACGQANRVPANGRDGPRCGRCRAALPFVVDADDDSFADVVERSRIPVVVDFWAAWCGPCRMVSPVLERLAAEFAGQIKLVKVDVDRAPGLSQQFDIRAVPTLLVMRGDRVVATQAGAAPAPALRRWLEDALATAR
ncbi:thioredoxin [Thermasporomyces composti]|uniref:Thioredoxin n=1 Tax=Thermasporomyces composti TaxID=696763 RepID=A0A3D9V1Q2_THECX|nr:thioredoxin [Thermasporomyces composti]REF35447.1 thioredoxin [Thermasporomyces composti]